jgi:threonine synthase
VFRARPSIATLSNAMDVGDPSNFARLAALHEGSAATMLAAIRGECVTESETREAIRHAHGRSGTILDPHAAVAYAAARRYRGEAGSTAPIVVLATAHPAKFAAAIFEELGIEPDLPAADRDWRTRQMRAVDLPCADETVFRNFLLQPRVPPAV